jgi:adenylate cyclase
MTVPGLRQHLVAILAADVSGYSRLMAADERSTVAALDAARAVFRNHIAAWSGRVIDMAGDSVLAVFDAATGAVSAALAVQAELAAGSVEIAEERRMRFRIGVHLGDVIKKEDDTVYGDGVNIAARLEGLAEPGGLTVSESVRIAVRGKLDASFEDQGEQLVKNIPYPVRAWRVRGSAPSPARANPAPPPKPIATATEADLSLPDKPSIAVLPFANVSGDQEQEYFCDGVTEDIITELSRYRTLFVIARNSTFTYKGKAVDVRTIGQELGVRYVVEGSIRRSGGRIRVTAQVVDALAGTHLWAERYDRMLEDIFDLQEELTRGIAAAIAPYILVAETDLARRLRPNSLRSYDLGLRAWANATDAMRSTDAGTWDKSVVEARQVVAADPRNTTALKIIATMQWLYAFLMPGDMSDAKARLQEGLRAASKVIELDPLDAGGHARLAILLTLVGRQLEALTSARQAHDLNPGDANVLLFLSAVEIAAGQSQQGLEHAHQAIRLSPRDPYIYVAHCNCATASFFLREHARGLDHALRAVVVAPNFVASHFNHCLLAVGVGDIAAAKAALSEVRRLAPKLAERVISHPSSAYHRPEDRERVMLAFRIAAGLEDGNAAEALR